MSISFVIVIIFYLLLYIGLLLREKGDHEVVDEESLKQVALHPPAL
jgi:hypothetical protein